MKKNGTALPAAGGSLDTATATLGLPGFVVVAAGEYSGELELLIETTSVTGCPQCGVVATLHDRKPRWVRGLAVRRLAGAAGVVQAGLGGVKSPLPTADLVGAERGDPAAGGADRTGPNVTVFGLDETAFLAATATCPTRFVTGLLDLGGVEPDYSDTDPSAQQQAVSVGPQVLYPARCAGDRRSSVIMIRQQ